MERNLQTEIYSKKVRERQLPREIYKQKFTNRHLQTEIYKQLLCIFSVFIATEIYNHHPLLVSKTIFLCPLSI